MTDDSLRLTPIQFPLAGNSAMVGLFSLLHIALAALSVGFIVLAPLFEYLGMKDPFYTGLAKTLAQFVAVIFSVSATFAVIMLELFIGLFPVTTVYLFNRFQPMTYAALGIFLLHIFCFYTYWYRWEKMRRKSVRRHIAWGAAAALLILIWGGVLDGLGSYMLTPPPTQAASLTAGAGTAALSLPPPGALPVNVTWIPLSLHRFVGSMIVSFYAIALYGGIRLLRRQGNEAGRRDDNRIMEMGVFAGTFFLLIQPIAGILYSARIGRANPQAIDRILHGPNRWLLVLQFILVGSLFVLCNRFFSGLTPDERRSRLFNAAILLTAVAAVVTVQAVAVRRILTLALVFETAGHLIFILPGKKPPEEGSASPWLAIGLGGCALLTFLTMGVIREQIRRPYTVYGQIHLQDEGKPTEFVENE